MRYPNPALLLPACIVLAATSQAVAGGFSRGTADTDIIFEDGRVDFRAGVTVVAPQRGYDTITAPAALGGAKLDGTDGRYSDTYAIPSVAAKVNVTDDFRCAGTYTISYGAGATYGPQAILIGAAADGTGTVEEGFTTNEFGATCGYKFDLTKGRAWLLGGLFVEDFDYSQTVQFITNPLLGPYSNTRATLSFDGDYEPGFRLGAAYEIPEIALRAQVLYKSGVDLSPTGEFSSVTDPVTGGPVGTTGSGSLPQSVELRLRSGIAPGWLAFGSVKWVDWSVLDTLEYNISTLPPPVGGDKVLEYFWKDGWTVTAGIGHVFTERVSGLVALTWDKGVSTTEDALTDTYTLASGVSVKTSPNSEFNFGGAVSYLTAGSVSASLDPRTGPGNSFAYTVDDDFAFAVSGSFKLKW